MNFMGRILFARHGESLANRQGVMQGSQVDTSLTDKGELQAKMLAGRLAESFSDIVKIVHTGLLRSKETADCLAEILEVESLEMCEDLREMDLPGMARLLKSEVPFDALCRAQQGEDVGEALNAYPDLDIAAFRLRVNAAASDLLNEVRDCPEDIIVVVHAGVLHALKGRLESVGAGEDKSGHGHANCALYKLLPKSTD